MASGYSPYKHLQRFFSHRCETRRVRSSTSSLPPSATVMGTTVKTQRARCTHTQTFATCHFTFAPSCTEYELQDQNWCTELNERETQSHAASGGKTCGAHVAISAASKADSSFPLHTIQLHNRILLPLSIVVQLPYCPVSSYSACL